MKKKLLALSVALAASQASAINLYDSEGTTFDINGQVTANYETGFGDSDLDTFELSNDETYLSFEGKQELGAGWVAEALIELSFANHLAEDTDMDVHRGYLGVEHDQCGRFRFGKQKSVYANAMDLTDQPMAYGSRFVSSRDIKVVYNTLELNVPDDTMSYQKVFMPEFGRVIVGLSWQDADNNDDDQNLFQGATRFEFDDVLMPNMPFVFGMAIASGEYADLYGIDLGWGQFDQTGWYVAAHVNFENQDGDADNDATDYEMLVSYRLENSLTMSLAYENADRDHMNDEIIEDIRLNTQYNITEDFVTFAGVQFDLTDSEQANEVTAGLRYYL